MCVIRANIWPPQRYSEHIQFIFHCPVTHPQGFSSAHRWPLTISSYKLGPARRWCHHLNHNQIEFFFCSLEQLLTHGKERSFPPLRELEGSRVGPKHKRLGALHFFCIMLTMKWSRSNTRWHVMDPWSVPSSGGEKVNPYRDHNRKGLAEHRWHTQLWIPPEQTGEPCCWDTFN